MQAMYTDEYLSMGGPASTESLAKAAGISADMEILDVGCGVGGPALHLAQSYGCHVTAIDLVDTSIELAQSNADLVTKMRRIVSELGFDIADPDAARQILGLKGKHLTNY